MARPDVNKRKVRRGAIFRTASLAIISFIMVYPLLWMMTNSFKLAETILRNPLRLVPDIYDMSNFKGALEMAPFDLYIWNSVFTATAIVAVQLVLSALMAYGLVFYKFPGKKLLFTAVMLTYMLPSAATYVPSYVILAKMGLLDSLAGLSSRTSRACSRSSFWCRPSSPCRGRCWRPRRWTGRRTSRSCSKS